MGCTSLGVGGAHNQLTDLAVRLKSKQRQQCYCLQFHELGKRGTLTGQDIQGDKYGGGGDLEISSFQCFLQGLD